MISHISLNQSPYLGDNNGADSYGLITRSDKVGIVEPTFRATSFNSPATGDHR